MANAVITVSGPNGVRVDFADIIRNIAHLGGIRLGQTTIRRRTVAHDIAWAYPDGSLDFAIGRRPTFARLAELAAHELAHLRWRTVDDTPTLPGPRWYRHDRAWRHELLRLIECAFPAALVGFRITAYPRKDDLELALIHAIAKAYPTRRTT